MEIGPVSLRGHWPFSTKFEHKITTAFVRPIEEIALLLDRGLIEAEEAARCERSYTALSSDPEHSALFARQVPYIVDASTEIDEVLEL